MLINIHLGWLLVLSFASVLFADDIRYKIPEDLGMPECFKEKRPCFPDDWTYTAKEFEYEINKMVADLVAQEIQEPECVLSMNCEEGEIEQYKNMYESIRLKVQEEMKKVNNMSGWWE